MISFRGFVIFGLLVLIPVGYASAACPSGTTEGVQITCIYDNGNDAGQFQVCLENGSASCAYGILYPGTSQTPEPFHGCEGQYSGIAYCGVSGGGGQPTATPTPRATRTPTSTPTPSPTLAPAGCNVGPYVQSINENGNLANEDAAVLSILKKNSSAFSKLWVRTGKESSSSLSILKRAIVSAYKIVLKGAATEPLSDQLSDFSLDAFSSLSKKCSDDMKTLAKSIAKNSSTIATALAVHEVSCDQDALKALAQSVCKKK